MKLHSKVKVLGIKLPHFSLLGNYFQNDIFRPKHKEIQELARLTQENWNSARF